MTNAAQAYRRVLVVVLTLLSLLAPINVQASLSHRTPLPFPDRAQHAAQQDLSAAQQDRHLSSNPQPTRHVGARDVGKAAAARRWVGASPTRPSQRQTTEYGKGGRLLKKREWTFEYDARGRRTAKVRTIGETVERTEYEWDGRDKLRVVRKPDGTRLDYSYDVFGRRVSKTRTGGPLDDKRVEFVWDGEVLAFELDTETGPRAFVHEPGGFEPILQQQGGETYLCVNDHLGMPKELIDGAGTLAWAAAHSAYGAVIASENDDRAVESPFRLLGQVNDPDAELAWTRFRCFDAETGTWISTDPLEIAGGLNLYGFDGSPSDVVDPLGLNGTSGGNHSGNQAPLKHEQGTTKPVTKGGTPNSVYTHVDPNTGKAKQNAVYDENGDVVAHIDFKNHGKDPKTGHQAVSGHGHTFSTPGDPSTGHGAGKTHHSPGTLPAEWSQLPPGIDPETPLGT